MRKEYRNDMGFGSMSFRTMVTSRSFGQGGGAASNSVRCPSTVVRKLTSFVAH